MMSFKTKFQPINLMEEINQALIFSISKWLKVSLKIFRAGMIGKYKPYYLPTMIYWNSKRDKSLLGIEAALV